MDAFPALPSEAAAVGISFDGRAYHYAQYSGIVFEGGYYFYGPYRYDLLSAALDYARHEPGLAPPAA
jgi:hypothetical protein